MGKIKGRPKPTVSNPTPAGMGRKRGGKIKRG